MYIIGIAEASLACFGHKASVWDSIQRSPSSNMTVQPRSWQIVDAAPSSELLAQVSMPSRGTKLLFTRRTKIDVSRTLATLLLAFNPVPGQALRSKSVFPRSSRAPEQSWAPAAHSRCCQVPVMRPSETTLLILAGLSGVLLGQFLQITLDKNKRKKKGEAAKAGRLRVCDLTSAVKKGMADPVLGLRPEINQLTQILLCRSRKNALLIGEPGSGRKAIVRGLAQLIAAGEVPKAFEGKRIAQIEFSGTPRNNGEMDSLKNRVVKESNNTIFMFGDINTILTPKQIKSGYQERPAPMSLMMQDIMTPMLTRGDAQVIVVATIAEYRNYIETSKALDGVFQQISVLEPALEQTIEIVKCVAGKYEQHHQVSYTSEALEACVKLSHQHITGSVLPGKAISVLDMAASSAQLRDFQVNRGNKSARQAEVVASDVAEVVAKWTKIPVEKVSSNESAYLLNLEHEIQKRFIGQEEAVTAVAAAVRRARAGMKDPNRPIASLLFCGPTGVGKTELCKALARAYFGKEDNMIRFDMSEFNTGPAVNKLIGSPPGYVGSWETPKLTDAVNRNPYSVLLFDELEKADTAVLDLLLQILEDGRLTDSQGQLLSFKNMLIIMTSNVGAESIASGGRGFGFQDLQDSEHAKVVEYERLKTFLMDKLKSSFRPEFLNRMDEVIVFKPLQRSQVREIAELEFGKVSQKMKERDISIILTEQFKQKVVDQGFDPSFGARPLRRAIMQMLEKELADGLLKESVVEGDTALVDLDADGNVLILPQG